MNLASAVTKAVVKQVDLPESVIRWVYEFVKNHEGAAYLIFKPYLDHIQKEYWEEFNKLDKEQDRELTSWYKKSPEAREKSSYDPDYVYTKKFKI